MIQFLVIVFVVITFTVLYMAASEPDRTPMERLYDEDD